MALMIGKDVILPMHCPLSLYVRSFCFTALLATSYSKHCTLASSQHLVQFLPRPELEKGTHHQ